MIFFRSTFRQKIVLSAILLFSMLQGFAQTTRKPPAPNLSESEHLMALALRFSRFDALKELVELKKYPVNRRFPSGFTPLQVMVWVSSNEAKEDTATNRAIIQYLVQKGASVKMKAPPFKKWMKLLEPYDSDGIKTETQDSLNALQLSVLFGNIDVVKLLMKYDPNTGIKDKFGNTLLHLAAMYDYGAKFDEHYVVKLFDLLMIDRNVVNNAGQNPLVYYVSKPQWVNTAKLVITYMINAGTNPDQHDHSGKNYYDYGKTVNPWIDSWIAQEKEWEKVKKVLEKFVNTPPVDFEQQTKDNLARYEAWKKRNGGCGKQTLTGEYILSFGYYLSSPYGPPSNGQQCSANQEPIEVVVSPDRISISTLSPYYGSFTVCESGYSIVNGKEYETYTFKTGANNQTYTGFGREKGSTRNAIIFTQNGSIMLSTFSFKYQ